MRNENRNLDRAAIARADLCRVWSQWLFEFSEHGADAYGTGRTVHRRAVPLSLFLGGRCPADPGRRVAAREPVRTAGAGAAWTGNREHHLLSRLPESQRSGIGSSGNGPVVGCLLR